MISTSYMKTNVLFECLNSFGTEFTFIYEEPVPSLHLSYSERAVTKAVSCCGLCEVIFNLVPTESFWFVIQGVLSLTFGEDTAKPSRDKETMYSARPEIEVLLLLLRPALSQLTPEFP